MTTEEKITNIIEILFHTEHRNIAGTTAEKAYEAYLKDKDLKTLKDSLEEYRDSLTGDDEMGISLSVNLIFQFINNIFVENQTGETALTDLIIAGLETKASSNLSEQSIALNKALEEVIGKKELKESGFLGEELSKPDSLVTHANSVTETLGSGQLLEYEAGKGSVSAVIGTIETGLLNKKGTTIADAIGSSPLEDFSLAGVKTEAADSLSGQLFAFTSATELTIGKKELKESGFLGEKLAKPDSLVTHANSVTETLGSGQLLEYEAGKGSVSTVIGTIETGLLSKKGTTIADAIGNKKLEDFVIAGVKTEAADSLSEHVVNFISAAEGILEKSMPSPSTARTINLCSYSKKDKGYTLEDEIYTTTNDPSQSWLNYLNCGKKIDEALESSIYIYIYISHGTSWRL